MADKFKEIEALGNVSSIDSLEQMDPYSDSDVTIFLKNGYRLISTRTLLGASIELQPRDAHSDLPAYRFIATNNLSIFGVAQQSTDNNNRAIYLKGKANSYNEPCTQDEFNSQVKNLIGAQLWNYLVKRHSSVMAVATTYGNFESTSRPTKTA